MKSKMSLIKDKLMDKDMMDKLLIIFILFNCSNFLGTSLLAKFFVLLYDIFYGVTLFTYKKIKKAERKVD